eukprot:scaffold24666_cov49-Attheya_sp.AAC.4
MKGMFHRHPEMTAKRTTAKSQTPRASLAVLGSLFLVAALSFPTANGFSNPSSRVSAFGVRDNAIPKQNTHSKRMGGTRSSGVESLNMAGNFLKNIMNGINNDEGSSGLGGGGDDGTHFVKKNDDLLHEYNNYIHVYNLSSTKYIRLAQSCGVSGLTAAITAAEAAGGKNSDTKVVLLESSPTLGGRVQSDMTEDGYVLDRGFAVFIEEYPAAKALLDYDDLSLGKFLPGALVKTKNSDELARVADPLRQPADIFVALLAPVGTLVDKIKVISLLATVFSKSVEQLFEEKETDTLTCLKNRYGFSDKFIDEFFTPFLEGIYLAPLNEQSSRMFHFVFKMFSEGAAALPKGGMGAVTDQLVKRAKEAGVEIYTNQPVSKLLTQQQTNQEEKEETVFVIQSNQGNSTLRAKSVVVATDGVVAQRILSTIQGFESLGDLPVPPQRSVGCLYYGFDNTELPVKDPILILNGMGQDRNTVEFPMNNCCFPSNVNEGYAPEGKGLCSVTVLKTVMDQYYADGQQPNTMSSSDNKLDKAVRSQLATWFPEQGTDISQNWVLKGIYNIPNAQPGQLDGPFPANVSGGRDCSTFRETTLPEGLFVCGDHMATATLNGALESGLNAGKKAAAKLLLEQ